MGDLGYPCGMTYTLVMEPDAEGGYTVIVPALPGCVTEGETEAECLANAREAIGLYLDELRDDGQPVPTESEPPRLVTVTV